MCADFGGFLGFWCGIRYCSGNCSALFRNVLGARWGENVVMARVLGCFLPVVPMFRVLDEVAELDFGLHHTEINGYGVWCSKVKINLSVSVCKITEHWNII